MSSPLETIEFQLHVLSEHGTVNGFLCDYYQLVFDTLVGEAQRDRFLCEAFSELLDIEIERHQTFALEGETEPLHGAELTELSSDQAMAFEELRERVLDRPRAPRAAQELIAAECSYYLCDVDATRVHLQAAMDAGCRSPIVCFSLGYNQFEQTLGRATTLDRAGASPWERLACLAGGCTEAVRSFGLGLRDEPFDGQIYYWIGYVCEVIGVHREALEAYGLAVAADESFEPMWAEKRVLLSNSADEDLPPELPDGPLAAFGAIVREILSPRG